MSGWRITLVRCDPESSNVFSGFAHPGLALPILGTALERAGHRVKIYVDVIQPPPWEELAASDLVGFTVNSASFRETYRLADRLRRETDVPVVFGGPHATFLPDEALDHGDYVIRGEGESAVVELVRELERPRPDLNGIAGLSWRGPDGAVHHNPERPLEEDLDLVPDQSLIVGYRELHRRWLQRIFPTGMLVSTSRGCPFRCTFCTIPQTFGGALRFRSHDAVIEDIRRQTELSGHRYIYFADDNFTGHRPRVKKLLARIIDEGLDIRFSAQVRADITRDQELVELLARAGCYLVFVGFESINEATLGEYNKGIRSRDVLERAIQVFHGHEIMVHGMFVIGSDEDPPRTALRTAEWARAQGLESLQMLPVCPLPGTEVLQQLDAEGRVYKAVDPSTGRSYIPYGAGSFVLHRPKRMTAVELQRELMAAYRRFYTAGGVLRAALRVGRNGLDPMIFRLLGRRIVRSAEAEVERHVAWLEAASVDPVTIAEAS